MFNPESERIFKALVSSSQDTISSTIDYIQGTLHRQYFESENRHLVERKIQSKALELFDCYTKEDRVRMVFNDVRQLDKIFLKIF